MGSVQKTPGGRQRAMWREPSGRQRSKTFKTKREANAFLSEVETALNRGSYISPDAGKVRFGAFAERWLDSREVQERTAERTLSVLRTHVLPQWSGWPLAAIDHMAVQAWVTGLVRRRARGTVVRCHSTLSMILKAATRARLIAFNPAEGVKIPSAGVHKTASATISQGEFFGRLLPAVPPRHRAIVCTAVGAGLRCGECAGIRWGDVDLELRRLRVVQVAVETAAAVTLRPFPKSRAGQRTVPLPGFLVDALRAHRGHAEPDEEDLVFPSRAGGPMRRNNFRRRVWIPSLVRGGLLGTVTETPAGFRAEWRDRTGKRHSAVLSTYREAVGQVVKLAGGGLRFHDLRHSYATWLISEGVPVNVVRKVMGHEQMSTTLDIYTHAPEDFERRVADALDGSVASALPGIEDHELTGEADDDEDEV